MSDARRKLATSDEARAALAAARQVLAVPDASVACPLCGAPGLVVIDRSARPHTEWFAISCAACGLDDTISVPMRG